MVDIKLKYLCERENGHCFSKVFKLYQIENGEAKEWMIVNNVYINDKTVHRLRFTEQKDKNREDIYEGHIMKNPKNNVVVYISFKDGIFGFTRDTDNAFTFMDESNRWEIIGDIYENSELIK